MIRNFFRHLLESIKSVKRNGWMTLASVSAVTITLTLAGIFLAVIMNATKLAQDVEGNVEVTVFVDIGTKEKELKTLKTELQDINHVDKVTFSSKADQLKKLQEQMGDAWDLFEGDSNPLYDVYVVESTDAQYIRSITNEASQMNNVFRANYGGNSADRIIQMAKFVRTWGLAAAALLVFVAIFLISNHDPFKKNRNPNHATCGSEKWLYSLAILPRRWLDRFDRLNRSNSDLNLWVPTSLWSCSTVSIAI